MNSIASYGKELEEIGRHLEWMKQTGNESKEGLEWIEARQIRIGQDLEHIIEQAEMVINVLSGLFNLLEKYRSL